MKKYIYSSIALFLLGFMVQSCFQDMDHPGFDYPEELPEKPYNPMKLGLAFEDNLEDNSIYNFGITADGTPHFAEGINGKAYQGATDTYMVVETPEAMKDSIENLGSFTVSFWMKATKCNKATGIFGISNTKQFWVIWISILKVIRKTIRKPFSKFICATAMPNELKSAG
ncbi:hypothetical protein KUBF_09140 [Bacteroides finegoldii]|nr:hypothetical protein KUBF_09140 [Bacteroides finegoldii]